MAISSSVRFWLYLIPFLPSLVFTILGLYRLRFGRALGLTLKNHGKFLLLSCVLIGELSDVPWHIHYYYTSTVLSSTPGFCIAWAFISSTTSVSISIIIAWTSIERHIATFYPQWLTTNTKRFFLHYVPLSTCILYPLCIYSVIFFTLPCDAPFHYEDRLCNRSECIFRNQFIALLDSITNYLIPVCVTVIFTVALLARVVYYRYRTFDRVEWDKYKKIAVQLLPISIFYIIIQLPPMVLYTAYSSGLSRHIASDYYDDCIYFRYWIILFIPFIYVTPFTIVQKRNRKIVVIWEKRCAVDPVIMNLPPQRMTHSIAAVSLGL